MESVEQSTPQENNKDHLIFGYTNIIGGTRHEVMDVDESLQPPQMSVRLDGTPVVMEVEEFERRLDMSS